jgi:hypothetical protein
MMTKWFNKNVREIGFFGSLVRWVLLLIFLIYFVIPMIWLLIAPSKSTIQFTTLNPLAFGSFAQERFHLSKFGSVPMVSELILLCAVFFAWQPGDRYSGRVRPGDPALSGQVFNAVVDVDHHVVTDLCAGSAAVHGAKPGASG